jgi:hypothetical protein
MPSNPGGVLSNWHTLFEDFSTSTQDFYIAVEQAIARRNLPEIQTSRVLFKERGIGSPAREYLRVRRYRVAFDICSAPYGNGHFFSWWLAKVPVKYSLFRMLGLLLGFALTLAALILRTRNSCIGSALSFGTLFLGIPIILLALGFGVERGLIGDEDWLLSVPVLGSLYGLLFNPVTYYRLDSAMMFRDSIRAAVNEVINDVRQEKGLRLLGEEELRPDARKEEAVG